MPRAVSHRFSAFRGGQSTVIDPLALPSGRPDAPEVGFRVVGAELRSGVLRGMFGPSPAVAGPAIAAETRFLFYISGTGWLARSITNWVAPMRQNWAMRGRRTGAQNVTYITEITAAGVVSTPTIRYGGASYRLGLASPTVAPTSSVAGTGVKFRYTYVTADGLESNPSPASIEYDGSGTVTITASADTRVTTINVWVTQDGDPNGDFYFLGAITAPAVTIAYAAATVTNPLIWDVYGGPDETVYVEDHAPAPSLTCLSNTQHGGAPGAGAGGANNDGMTFGAVDDYATWSMLNRPQYWPQNNYYRLPEHILAVVTIGTSTAYFLEGSVWVATGDVDYDVRFRRSRAPSGVLPFAGKTAQPCPWGVLYLSREGVMLFDFDTAVNLTKDLMKRPDIFAPASAANVFWSAVYHEGLYFFGSGTEGGDGDVTYCLDLTDYPSRIGLVKLNRVLRAMHVVTDSALGVAQGNYVALDDNTLRYWVPTAEDATLDREAAQHKTGLVTFGSETAWKDLQRWKIAGSGPVTMKVYVDPTDLTSDASPTWTVTVTLPMKESRCFPPNCKGRAFSFLFDVPDGSELHQGSRFEAVTNE